MSYQVAILEMPGYLHVRVTGQNSPESVRGYMADTYQACAQRQCPAVLIEEELTGPGLGMVDMFEIVSEGIRRTWPHVLRIAYVDTNPAHSPADLEFATIVAANRGLNIRLFANVSDAAKWLSASAQGG